MMHGCVRIARPRVPGFPVPSSAGRCRLERAAVKPSMRRWCLCLHRWRCLGPKICRIKAVHVAGWQVWTRRHAWLSLSRCTVVVSSMPAFLGDALCLALGLAASALPRYHNRLGKTHITVCAALQSSKWITAGQHPRQAPFSYLPREIWSGAWHQHQSAANSRVLCDFCYSGNARNAKLGEGVPELPVVMQGRRQE